MQSLQNPPKIYSVKIFHKNIQENKSNLSIIYYTINLLDGILPNVRRMKSE